MQHHFESQYYFTKIFTTRLTFLVTKIMPTVIPVYNKDHPWDPKIVAVVDRWSLFKGQQGCKQGVAFQRLVQVWLLP